MSARPDGGYECDRCGADVGNGGIQSSAILTDLDPASGDVTPIRYDLCRDRPDPDRPGKTIQGCRDRVLTKKALRHHHEKRAST